MASVLPRPSSCWRPLTDRSAGQGSGHWPSREKVGAITTRRSGSRIKVTPDYLAHGQVGRLARRASSRWRGSQFQIASSLFRKAILCDLCAIHGAAAHRLPHIFLDRPLSACPRPACRGGDAWTPESRAGLRSSILRIEVLIDLHQTVTACDRVAVAETRPYQG